MEASIAAILISVPQLSALDVPKCIILYHSHTVKSLQCSDFESTSSQVRAIGIDRVYPIVYPIKNSCKIRTNGQLPTSVMFSQAVRKDQLIERLGQARA